MPQVSLRISDEVDAEIERGRIAQHFDTRSEYISALVLAGVGRVSGLSQPGTLDSTATDARIGGAVTNAISAINNGDSASAIQELRFAQTVILESLTKKKPLVDKPVLERLRVRGGGDDWAQAERE